MDDATSDNLDRADEDILTPTVSDEAIEAGGGIESQNNTVLVGSGIAGWPCCPGLAEKTHGRFARCKAQLSWLGSQ
jgi:hypothetical protein